MNKARLSSIELFCGAGGLALGLQEAGFDHKALYEWNIDAVNTVRANIDNGFLGTSGWSVHQQDVRSISYGSFSRKLDLVSGGPPCQPFSIGGLAKAHQDGRDMFPEAVRAVREIRPKAFIFENVKGLLRPSFSSYFDYIILSLKHPGIERKESENWQAHKARIEAAKEPAEYSVKYKLLNAADYGVPQNRQRVMIIGFRSDLTIEWDFPTSTHSKEALSYSKWVDGSYWERHDLPRQDCPLSKVQVEKLEAMLSKGIAARQAWRTTRDAIGDLPDPRSEEARAIPNHDYRPGARSYKGHTGSVLDEAAKTIKAGVHGVPGGENTLILDSGETRYLTVRESARIQTFPDGYLFNASWTESMRQIGNAVPVLLACKIGQSVAKALEELA